jgi:hypothetical protein
MSSNESFFRWCLLRSMMSIRAVMSMISLLSVMYDHDHTCVWWSWMCLMDLMTLIRPDNRYVWNFLGNDNVCNVHEVLDDCDIRKTLDTLWLSKQNPPASKLKIRIRLRSSMKIQINAHDRNWILWQAEQKRRRDTAGFQPNSLSIFKVAS